MGCHNRGGRDQGIGYFCGMHFSSEPQTCFFLLAECHISPVLFLFFCSRNFLPKIPSELCHMNLFSINLSNNRLLAIPNEIGKLKRLQFLVRIGKYLLPSPHLPSLLSVPSFSSPFSLLSSCPPPSPLILPISSSHVPSPISISPPPSHNFWPSSHLPSPPPIQPYPLLPHLHPSLHLSLPPCRT